MILRCLNEEARTYLYGCEFHLDADVLDMDEAQDYLDDDRNTMIDVFNDDINGDYRPHPHASTDKPLINWRWYLDTENSGYFIYETSRELTDDELENLADGTVGQASDGIGEGFEQQDFAYYEVYYDEFGHEVPHYYDYDREEEFVASFDWEKGYKLRPLSHSYRRFL